MTLKQTKQRGFTIVELLIVVVIIAILAAITIVAYNGIQNRAKTSAAKSSAATVQKKAEIAVGTSGSYPTTTAGFASADTSASLAGSSIRMVGSAPANTFGNNDVSYRVCTVAAAGNSLPIAEIGIWNSQTNAAEYTVLGAGTSAGCTTWASYVTGGPL